MQVVLGLIDVVEVSTQITSAMFKSAKKEHITRTARAFMTKAERMMIPSLGPLSCVFIDSLKEKVVEEPNMSIVIGI